MVERGRIALLGGDERQIYLARALAQRGRNVWVWGLGDVSARVCPAKVANTPEEALRGAVAVLLPMPASLDGVRVHAPLAGDESLRFSYIAEHWEGGLLLGGKLPPVVYTLQTYRPTEVIDYFQDDILQLKNALPTAEGAIAIAMRELPVTIDGIHAAVIGYGRIATVLADKLTALGAQVYLYARKPADLTRAALRHLFPMRLSTVGGRSSLCSLPRDCRVIFNTVPCPLFTHEVIETLPRDCLYIDLASAPGGIDWSAAKELGIRTVWGTALPGKCVPESAGLILAEFLDDVLETKGVDLC
ncbi:MAG: dipicolinate synthase [Clostridia bacterium]|nr:dipicolinate synthase [Clostridia bacterium]